MKKKLENFWYYYKIHVIVAIVVVLMIGGFIKEKMDQIHYDYTVAVMTESEVDAEDLQQLQEELEACAVDRNGDKEIRVEVLSYIFPQIENANPSIVAANQTKFTVDVQMGTSMIFVYSEGIKEVYRDPELFEEDTTTALPACGESLKDLKITLRAIEGSSIADKKEIREYHEDSKILLEKFLQEKES